jgi:hypothetical protein
MRVATDLTHAVAYGLVQTDAKTKRRSLAYAIGSSPKEVWERVLTEELLGTGHTKESLQKLGWTAEIIIVMY